MTDTRHPNPDPLLVRDAATLAEFVARLATRPRVALDTEAASFHRYVDRVYLVQASTDDETAVVDPLAVEDLAPIGRLLAEDAVEKIFHDADYDLRILDRDYGFRARRIWDTRIAAQLAGETAFGLGALLEKYFEIRLSKKLQRADWSRRPLTEEMLRYAANDTAHLPALRDLLAEQLRSMGRLTWAEEEFARLEDVRWTGAAHAEDAFLRLKGAKALPRRSLAILRAVYEWREGVAQHLDRAPFRIVGNDALVAIAKAAPTSPADLTKISEVPSSIARRHGPALLEAVAGALAAPPADWPVVERTRRPTPDPDADARYQRLRALRTERAEAVTLDPGILCPNGTLHAVARAAPRTSEDLDAINDLRRWQREALGEDAILEAVHEAA